MKVRTRVAPSPTGDPHVGTAYIALVNYCFAKKHGGSFVLRIEDTDRARSTAASERVVLESLRWLGLSWSEGPDVGGPYGPYRQSERSYWPFVAQLIEQGDAFRCYCTEERLARIRDDQRKAGAPPRYDGRCLHLSAAERDALEYDGVPHVVRMKIPRAGSCLVEDLRRGRIEIEWSTVDMQILLKSDKMPTYHLANVVDDHLMDITHIFRGEEWISSAPKHILLYQYFGWEVPKLCHLPLLRNLDRSKLSKRKNPTSILFYRKMGYLPEALVNFLGLLISSVASGSEMISLAELVERFEIENVSLAGPIFDVAKLNWLNARYIRETLSPEGLLARLAEWASPSTYLQPILAIAQPRIERLSDLGPLVSFFFSGELQLSFEQLRDNRLTKDQQIEAYRAAIAGLDQLEDWNVDAIEHVLRVGASTLDVKFRDYVRPFYFAITGRAQSVPLFDSISILGRDLCRHRLRQAIVVLESMTGTALA